MRITVEFESWDDVGEFCLETLSRQGYRIAAPGTVGYADGAAEPDTGPEPEAPAAPAPATPARRGAGRPSKAEKESQKAAQAPVAQGAGNGTKAGPPANGKSAAAPAVSFEQMRGALMELRKLTGNPDLPRKIVSEIAGAELLDQVPAEKYRDVFECTSMKLAELARASAGSPDPLGI